VVHVRGPKQQICHQALATHFEASPTAIGESENPQERNSFFGSALQTPGSPPPGGAPESLTYVDNGIYIETVARSSTTSDVFNAIADAHRREVLDALITGEKAVGAIVNDLSMSQPQVSKHLRVLSDVGLVKCRADGRRRLYRLDHEHLRPLYDWLEKYEQSWNGRLDRMDNYPSDLQRKERTQ